MLGCNIVMWRFRSWFWCDVVRLSLFDCRRFGSTTSLRKFYKCVTCCTELSFWRNCSILRSAHTAVFICFVWIWEQTAIISLYSIKFLPLNKYYGTILNYIFLLHTSLCISTAVLPFSVVCTVSWEMYYQQAVKLEKVNVTFRWIWDDFLLVTLALYIVVTKNCR